MQQGKAVGKVRVHDVVVDHGTREIGIQVSELLQKITDISLRYIPSTILRFRLGKPVSLLRRFLFIALQYVSDQNYIINNAVIFEYFMSQEM